MDYLLNWKLLVLEGMHREMDPSCIVGTWLV
jgi:hypothetical protein